MSSILAQRKNEMVIIELKKILKLKEKKVFLKRLLINNQKGNNKKRYQNIKTLR